MSAPTPPTVPDDTNVPRITSTKGWRPSRTTLGTEVFIAPDGVQYTTAHRLEAADLIRVFDNGLTPMRLVLLEGSSAERGERKIHNLAAGKTRRQRARKR